MSMEDGMEGTMVQSTDNGGPMEESSGRVERRAIKAAEATRDES
jgi:hypothetical protein